MNKIVYKRVVRLLTRVEFLINHSTVNYKKEQFKQTKEHIYLALKGFRSFPGWWVSRDDPPVEK